MQIFTVSSVEELLATIQVPETTSEHSIYNRCYNNILSTAVFIAYQKFSFVVNNCVLVAGGELLDTQVLYSIIGAL